MTSYTLQYLQCFEGFLGQRFIHSVKPQSSGVSPKGSGKAPQQTEALLFEGLQLGGRQIRALTILKRPQ